MSLTLARILLSQIEGKLSSLLERVDAAPVTSCTEQAYAQESLIWSSQTSPSHGLASVLRQLQHVTLRSGQASHAQQTYLVSTFQRGMGKEDELLLCV